MSVAIRLDHDPDRPERSFICECGALVVTRAPAQKYCRACAGKHEARRQEERHAAPQLRIATEDTSPTVAMAYESWRMHHAWCGHCSKHDWFDPGAPRLCAPDDVVRSRTITTTDGRVLGVVDGPDVSVLCAAGRDRFLNWTRSAMMGLRLGGRS